MGKTIVYFSFSDCEKMLSCPSLECGGDRRTDVIQTTIKINCKQPKEIKTVINNKKNPPNQTKN